MKRMDTFEKDVLKIALPVTGQLLLQSSFSIIDQIMIGRLGSDSIAGIGLAGKFSSLYTVILGAVTAVAGIMISQYIGKEDRNSYSRSFYVNMALSVVLAMLFMGLCVVFPDIIMGFYTKDADVHTLAASYLRIYAVSFLPVAVISIVTTMLRCMDVAVLPLYASFFGLILNTGLNYLFIFGKWIFPKMGVEGAALASVTAQMICCGIILFFFMRYKREWGIKWNTGWLKKSEMSDEQVNQKEYWRQYIKILCPVLVCEFLWSLGENIYTAIYGNIGTDACAAMTVTVPVQTIVIGGLGGLSQAAGILIGKSQGAGKYEQAYGESKKLIKYGIVVSITMSVILLAVSPFYIKLFRVEPSVQRITRELLIVIALIAPVKVLNMILGGGIIRSGGKTKYSMWIDIMGTWLIGVPLGLLAAFVWKLPITPVYFLLSMEECVRLGVSFFVFRRKKWMESIQ